MFAALLYTSCTSLLNIPTIINVIDKQTKNICVPIKIYFSYLHGTYFLFCFSISNFLIISFVYPFSSLKSASSKYSIAYFIKSLVVANYPTISLIST